MVTERWRPLKMTARGRRIQDIYRVSSWGRVLRTTETNISPAGYRLRIQKRWSSNYVSLCADGLDHSFNVHLIEIFRAAWPESPFPLRNVDDINQLNDLSDAENITFKQAWLAQKKELKALRAKQRAEARRNNEPTRQWETFSDPWAAGEIPQRPHFRTPDPQLGF
jgi:hypothetical protein